MPPHLADPPYFIERNVSLAKHCTLELGGDAAFFANVDSLPSLVATLSWARRRGMPSFVLGGGSNVVFDDAGFDGLVLRMAIRDWHESVTHNGQSLRVGAGVEWDSVVQWACERNLSGIECLSGIPGTVGATPIQNVGAYGQEVCDAIVDVEVYEPATESLRTISRETCRFAYRSSAFKTGELRSAVITAVRFALHPNAAPTIGYPELRSALERRETNRPLRPSAVRKEVLELRRAKSMLILPDDPNRRNVGSFFLNPVVDTEEFERIAARCIQREWITSRDQLPRFDAGTGRLKIPAAWLVERAGGTKGLRRGSVGVSSRHSLCLVHHGGGSTRELLTLAHELREAVEEQSGVRLELEPVVVRA